MSVVYAHRSDDFDPIDLTFINNTICYRDATSNHENYLVIVTGKCAVLHVSDTEIWLVADTKLQRLIRDIDVQFIQHRSSDTASYLKLADSTTPSLKLSPSSNYDLLKVNLRTSTEIYGNIRSSRYARVVIKAHYNRTQIYWHALKVQCDAEEHTKERSEGSEDLGFLNECQLGQKLIKI